MRRKPVASKNIITRPSGVTQWLGVLVGAIVAVTGQAATITVDTNTDDVSSDGNCSLREAVSSANDDVAVDTCTAGDGDDTITFAVELAGQTITLQLGEPGDDENTGGDLDIFGSNETPSGLTIRGPVAGDATSITLDGNGIDRVIDVPFGSLVNRLQLTDLTISNGRLQDFGNQGGGIRVAGSNTFLSLDNVRVVGNGIDSSEGGGLGGGIYTLGPFSITNSVVSGNSLNVNGDAEGGGLYALQLDGGDQNVIGNTEISANAATSSAGSALGGGVRLVAVVFLNSPPVVAAPIPDRAFTTVSDSPASINLTPVFTDPDGDTLLYSVSVADPGVASATLNSNSLVITPLAEGITTVSVTADDQLGGTVTDTFSVMVANQPPVVDAPIADQTFFTGDPALIVDLNSVFSDPDGDTLLFSAISSNPSAANAMVSGGDLTVTPLAAGNTNVTVTADDQNGGTVDDVFSVNVAPGNQPPVVASLIPKQVLDNGDEGGINSASIDLTPIFSDPDGDTLAYTAISSDFDAVDAQVAGSQLDIAAVNFASGAPDVTVTVTANDGNGGTVNTNFTVESNLPPFLANPIPDQISLPGGSVEIDLTNVFSDPNGDTLSYTFNTSSSSYVASVDTSTLTVIDQAGLGGTATVNIFASDPGGSPQAGDNFDIDFGTTARKIELPEHGVGTLQIADAPVQVRISNTTISGNTATGGPDELSAGGGLYASGPDLGVGLNNVTISANQASAPALTAGGGLAAEGAEIELSNTLVAANTTADGSPDCTALSDGSEQTGVITSAGYNLIGDGSGCALESDASDQVGSDTAPISPLLGALGDNGGGTRTHALLPGSPAIDAGNPEIDVPGACETTDQRGRSRPRDGDRSGTAECDIGAFEAALNEAPTIVNAIPDQTLAADGDDVNIDLTTVFSDPEGDILSFSAISGNTDVATAVVEGAVLTITPIAPGRATITVTATDGSGNTTAARLAVSGRSGAVTAGGGGCVLAPDSARFDPMLWLLLITAVAWRGRSRYGRRSAKAARL